jgi:Protein of unknown function (DUF3341)
MTAVWGMLAEFESPQQLVSAAKRAHEQGYRQMDAYTPFPVPEVSEALGSHKNRVPLLCLLGGLMGGGTAYALQYWVATMAFPINVGGRPLHSWPSFIPVTFEMTVLFASFGAFFGMWALNGLPKLFHPIFNVERFAAASRNRFFLCIESSDPQFELHSVRAFLMSLEPQSIEEVPYR